MRDQDDLLLLPNQAPELGILLASQGDLALAYSQTLTSLAQRTKDKGKTFIRGFEARSYRESIVYDLNVKQVHGMYLDFRKHRDFRIGGDAILLAREPEALEPQANLTVVHLAGLYNFNEDGLQIAQVMKPSSNPSHSGIGFVLGAGLDYQVLKKTNHADNSWLQRYPEDTSPCNHAGDFQTTTLSVLPGLAGTYLLTEHLKVGGIMGAGLGWDRYRSVQCPERPKTAYLVNLRGSMIWVQDHRYITFSGYREGNSRLVDSHWTSVTLSSIELAVGMLF